MSKDALRLFLIVVGMTILAVIFCAIRAVACDDVKVDVYYRVHDPRVDGTGYHDFHRFFDAVYWANYWTDINNVDFRIESVVDDGNQIINFGLFPGLRSMSVGTISGAWINIGPDWTAESVIREYVVKVDTTWFIADSMKGDFYFFDWQTHTFDWSRPYKGVMQIDTIRPPKVQIRGRKSILDHNGRELLGFYITKWDTIWAE